MAGAVFAAFKAYESELLQKKNVVGIGIGNKLVGGIGTEEPALIIFVEKKEASSRIGKYSADFLPQAVDGVAVDVIEVGRLVKHGYRTKVRPIQPGYSCGHPQVTAGTIGGIFLDRDDQPVILSNAHVLANENLGVPGDPIYQPGILDNSDRSPWRGWVEPVIDLPYIATLKQSIKLNSKGNRQDSAIAAIPPELIRARLVNPEYPEVHQTLQGFEVAQTGMEVQKFGRTTGHTTGKIIARSGKFTIGYDFGSAEFTDCIVTTAMSQGGDSGSLLCDQQMRALALLFAGSPKVTLYNPIEIVRQQYGLKLWQQPVAPLSWQTNADNGTQLSWDGNSATINACSNQFCYLEAAVNQPFSEISCTINPQTDGGASWGPGVTLLWANAVLKLNLRCGGSFGVSFNGQEYLGIGKVKTGQDHQFKIVCANGTVKAEGNDGSTWYTLFESPLSNFSRQLAAVRLGKTDSAGQRSSYNPIGNRGTCTITKIVVR